MNGLSLFSGIGGIDLALEEWVRPIAYCEKDPYAQSVLFSRMRDGRLPVAPIWDDVSTLNARLLPKSIDIIYGGFPCQDISVAGAGAGLGGSRSGLFFEIVRLIGDFRPSFVFLENVPAITVRGLDRVLMELTALGYDCRWTIVSAAEMGAVHIRERWFLLAHANSLRLREERRQKVERGNPGRTGPMEHYSSGSSWGITRTPQWRTKPRVGRTGDGIPYRMDRHRGLGNAVHPEAAREAFIRLSGIRSTE